MTLASMTIRHAAVRRDVQALRSIGLHVLGVNETPFSREAWKQDHEQIVNVHVDAAGLAAAEQSAGRLGWTIQSVAFGMIRLSKIIECRTAAEIQTDTDDAARKTADLMPWTCEVCGDALDVSDCMRPDCKPKGGA